MGGIDGSKLEILRVNMKELVNVLPFQGKHSLETGEDLSKETP